MLLARRASEVDVGHVESEKTCLIGTGGLARLRMIPYLRAIGKDKELAHGRLRNRTA